MATGATAQQQELSAFGGAKHYGKIPLSTKVFNLRKPHRSTQRLGGGGGTQEGSQAHLNALWAAEAAGKAPSFREGPPGNPLPEPGLTPACCNGGNSVQCGQDWCVPSIQRVLLI